VPTESGAFDSVEKIMRDVNWGWLLRYAHSVGGSMFFLAVYIHTFRGLYYGSYKAPREVLWILGVLILMLMIATAFMGYSLPWGQMSFWAVTVITNLFSSLDAVIPGLGTRLVQWIWGGFAVGGPTLNRLYSLHYLFPFLIAGVVALHIWALHIPGNNNPTGIDVKVPTDTVPFHPYYTIKDGFALVAFILVFAAVVFYAPNFLGHPDNYVPANPLQTPTHIVPEWYFLPFYAILRAIPNKLLGVAALNGSILILFFVPWLDTSKVRSTRYRPIYKWFFWAFVVTCVALGYLGAQQPEGLYLVLGRIFTARTLPARRRTIIMHLKSRARAGASRRPSAPTTTPSFSAASRSTRTSARTAIRCGSCPTAISASPAALSSRPKPWRSSPRKPR